MPLGIKGLSNQVALNPIAYVAAKFSFPGIGKLRIYEAAKELFGQKIIRTKNRGVEPGFIAQKVWTERDDKKLFDKGHKFHQEAVKFLNREFEELDPTSRQKVAEHLTQVFLKFKKEHWWKLHYAEPLFGRVMIDYAQAKHLIHRLGTAETPREKNLAALMEVLSNDIFTVLGFGGQKLTLRLAKYKNNYPMLLLDGTEVVGPNGEKFHTLDKSQAFLKGPKGQGRIKDNMLLDPETNQMVPIDESKLGSSLMKALLMGDRDKVGKLGDNLGYIVVDGKAVLMNIDPGKSLEKPCWWRVDRMIGYVLRNQKYERPKVKCDIRTDAIFDQEISPKDLFTSGYVNFSIFNDTQLADRVQGIKDIKEKWPQIVSLFKQYYDFFKEHEAILDPHRSIFDKPIYQEIQEQFDRLQARAAMFLDILGERAKLSPEELNLLDNLEKLTSPTTKKAPVEGEEKEVDLKYLRIIDPQKNRIEWSIEDNSLLTFVAKDQTQFDQITKTLSEFIHTAQIQAIELKGRIRGEVQFNGGIPFDAFTHAKVAVFKETKIVEYKAAPVDISLTMRITILVITILSNIWQAVKAIPSLLGKIGALFASEKCSSNELDLNETFCST